MSDTEEDVQATPRVTRSQAKDGNIDFQSLPPNTRKKRVIPETITEEESEDTLDDTIEITQSPSHYWKKESQEEESICMEPHTPVRKVKLSGAQDLTEKLESTFYVLPIDTSNIVEGEDGTVSIDEVSNSTYNSVIEASTTITPYGSVTTAPGDTSEPRICAPGQVSTLTTEQKKNIYIVDPREYELTFIALRCNILPEHMEEFIEMIWEHFPEIIQSDKSIREKYQEMVKGGLQKEDMNLRMIIIGKTLLEIALKKQWVNIPQDRVTTAEGKVRNVEIREIIAMPELDRLNQVDLTEIIDWKEERLCQVKKMYTRANDKNNLIWALEDFFEEESLKKKYVRPEIPPEVRLSWPCRRKGHENEIPNQGSYQRRPTQEELLRIGAIHKGVYEFYQTMTKMQVEFMKIITRATKRETSPTRTRKRHTGESDVRVREGRSGVGSTQRSKGTDTENDTRLSREEDRIKRQEKYLMDNIRILAGQVKQKYLQPQRY